VATNQQLLDRIGRLIAESTASLFSAPVRQEYLNAALALACQRIVEVAPEEFEVKDTAPIVANQQDYERPTYENVRRYELLMGTTYREIPPSIEEQNIARTDDVGCYTNGQQRWNVVYTISGTKLLLWPTPPVSITAGLRVVFYEWPVLVAAADVPRMPSALHPVLAYGAAIYLLEESKDAGDDVMDIYRQRWASVFGPMEASTPDSRDSLKKHFRVHQARAVTGQNLGQRSSR
jgi:hypothetical protein